MSAKNKSNEGKKIAVWIRTVNILANAGQWFVIPYAGTALAQIPSLEVAGFTMLIGLVMSASREGLDVVREHTAAL